MDGSRHKKIPDNGYVSILRRIYGALEYHNEKTPDECLPAHIHLPKGVSRDEAEIILEKMKEDGLVTSFEYPFLGEKVYCDMLDGFADGYGYLPGGEFLKDFAIWVKPGFREKTHPLLYPKKYKPGSVERITIMYSHLFGLHFPGTPQINFWPTKGTKRAKMMELLFDDNLTAEEIAEKVGSRSKQIYSEVEEINNNFRQTLGTGLPDIITNSDKSGYFMDRFKYDIRDSEY